MHAEFHCTAVHLSSFFGQYLYLQSKILLRHRVLRAIVGESEALLALDKSTQKKGRS